MACCSRTRVAASGHTHCRRHSTLDALTTLLVRTDNSVYRITILTPHRGEVVVQGGAFFPERRPV